VQSQGPSTAGLLKGAAHVDLHDFETACRSLRIRPLQLSRCLDWQLPPRRFWSWWCGGIDLRDAVVLAFVLAFNAWYFADYYITYDKWIDAGGFPHGA
jgi:hypothetical protein